MPISYKNKIYTTLGTPTILSGDVVSATDSAGVPTKDYTIKGKTIVWNQLFTNSRTSSNGVTISQSQDGTMTLSGTATKSYINFTNLSDAMNQVHKYLLCLKILDNPDNVSFYYSWLNRNMMRTEAILNGESCVVCSQSEAMTQLEGGNGLTGFTVGTVFNNVKIAVMCMDLTQMFGAGNEPTTVEEFRAMFPNDCYPYNDGELKTIVPTSVEASGVERFQLLDKSKYRATIIKYGVTFTNNGDGTITANGTATQDVWFKIILGAPLLLQLGHKMFLTGCPSGGGWMGYLMRLEALNDDAGNGKIFSANAKEAYLYIFIKSGYVANNLIFKPQLFDLTQMFGAGNEPSTPEEFWQRVPEKLYGYNPNAYKSANIPSSKYFPDGMRSAGSAYDEINFLSQKAIRRIGVVDLGTLNWSYSTSHTAFQTNDLNTEIKFPATSSDAANLICTKYSAESYASGWVGTIDKCCGTTFATGAKWFWIRDTAYTDAAAFKATMSGVMLYYELATPVETAITPPLQALSTFKGFTSFSTPNSLTQNGPISVTYYAEGGANPESGWLTSYKRKLYMGRNIEWNQLINKYQFYPTRTTANGVTIINNQDGTLLIDCFKSDVQRLLRLMPPSADLLTAGHKYLFSGSPYPFYGNRWYMCYLANEDDGNKPIDMALDYGNNGNGQIVTGVNANVSFCIGIAAQYRMVNHVFKPQLFNLTQMFGAGNEPATPAEFWSYFDHKLYPYNAGETQPLFKISRKSIKSQ